MIRVGEIKSLISEIEDSNSNFMKCLNLPRTAKIDMDKLVLSGHSVGSTGTIIEAFVDKRVKALYLIDTWNQIYSHHIDNLKVVNLNIPLGCISSETFNPYVK